MKEINEKKIKYILYIGIFLFMFVWFVKVHPLVVLDGDDWGHLSFARRAIPELSLWNPAKLFPEIFMSFCCTIAAYTIVPITGDYILSMTLMSAIVMSGLITLYVYSLGSCLKRLFAVSTGASVFVEGLFLILHFLIFRKGDVDNTYLFYCVDLNCYYNYLMPALLNASIVLLLFKNEKLTNFLQRGDNIKKGLLYVVIYFAIFSNLVDSVILLAYASMMILLDIFKIKSVKNEGLQFLKRNFLYFGIIFAWVISAVSEALGGRAALSGSSDTRNLGVKLAEVISGLSTVFSWTHKMFLLLCAVLVISVVALLILEKRKNHKVNIYFLNQLFFWGLMLIFTFVYSVLICAKVSTRNIYRSEYLFPTLFFGLVLLMFLVVYILEKLPKAVVLMPLLVCIMLTFVNTNLHTFKESNYFNVSGKLCMDISRDLVNQVIEANQAGKTEIELEVSMSGHDANWPQSYAMGESMAIALYKHGVISRPMKIKIVPSTEYNDKYLIFQ